MPPTRPDFRRFPFLALALLLALLVAVLGGTSFQRRVDSFKPLGFEGLVQGGAFLVTKVDEPRGVESRGGESGLRPGDEILLVQGETFTDPRQLGASLRSKAQSQLVVKRGDELIDVTYLRLALDIDLTYLLLAATGVFYLLIGLYTALKDERGPARLFFFWSLASAALYLLSPVLPPADGVDRTIFLVDQLARSLLPALTLHLFLVFPTSLLGSRRGRFALPGIYLPSALLIAFHLDQIFVGGSLFGRATPEILAFVDRLELHLLVLFVLLAVLLLLVRLARHREWLERRQVQWIVAGMLGGYVPFFLLYVVPYSLGLAWPAWSRILAVLPLALVPLGFAYAILRHKLWDIGIVLRDTVTYSLTILVGLCGFTLFRLLIERGLSEDMASARTFLTFAAGLVMAGVLVPTRNAISSGIERFQYRGTLAQRRALGRLGSELLQERDLMKLCSTLIERLEDGLGTRVNLYLARGDGRMAPTVPDPDLPPELSFSEWTGEVWQRDVISLSPVGLPESGESALDRVFVAGYRYGFPLEVSDHRVGMLLVSYKYGEEPLNSEDLELTRGLLNQASLAIENAHLLEEIRHRLAEVERLEEHNKGIIDSSPAGLAVLDADDRVVLANRAFIAIAERPDQVLEAADVVGERLEDLLPVRPLPEPGGGLMEVGYGELSGRERYLQMAMAPYEYEGQMLRILIVQDSSELYAMEAALKEKERLASLGLLAAGVAHEVNTPLTGISSYAQFLLSDIDEEHPHYPILKKLERQSFRAAQIVNNLLEFSRNRHDESAPVHLPGVIEECLQMLDERLLEAGVEVDYSPPADAAAARVLGHEGELHQVFTNLMVNAIDAMANTGGQLKLSFEATPDQIRTLVSDTGPGIPPERLERIFQPFFSSKLQQGGTGLGLAITYNIVRRHRGEIRVENHSPAEDGSKGCTFVVELPRLQS